MYILNEEQEMVRKLIKDFVCKKIEPGVNERVNNKVYPEEILKELGELGYMGLMTPEEFGGSGLDAISSMIIIHELGRIDASIAHMVEALNFAYCYPVHLFATKEQKEKYLIPCAQGNEIGVLAFNEPDGIGAGQIKTTAKIDGDFFILNGTKSMITDAQYADYAILYAQTDENFRGFAGHSTFLVDLRNNPGVTIGKEEETMGLQSLRIAEIHFDNVRVPKTNLLGAEGQGIFVIAKSMELMRISNAAVALGIAEKAYEEVLSYVKLRSINSVPMHQLEAVQFELAEMKAKIELMKLSIYYSAQIFDMKIENVMLYSSISKYMSAEFAKEVCDRAVQMFGGYGYIRGYTVERLYRDVRVMSIIGGNTEMLKWSIANTILKD